MRRACRVHPTGMSLLRRRTSVLISLVLACCLLAGLAGAALVLWREPVVALRITLCTLALAAAVTRSLGERGPTFALLGGMFTILGLGLYALHRFFGVGEHAIAMIAAALASLVAVMLMRALIAAGSADDPYDDA